MSVASFNNLVETLKPHIKKQYTKFRNPLEPIEMIGITLRYLGSGNSINDLHFKFKRGRATISRTISSVCQAIWKYVRPLYIEEITVEKLQNIALDFDLKANFPHCFGAIDGKHIRLIKPDKSGSLFYNYKKYFSIVLLAVVDSNYKFVFVDVGAYGKESDSTIFRNSTLYKILMRNELPLPDPQPLGNDHNNEPPIPYVLVGDEAFGLSKHVMRPYGGSNLNVKQRVYNYRLSRARRYVECAFGIMANKWRILHRPIDTSYDLTINIAKACCVLHNFVIQHDGLKQQDNMAISRFSQLRPHSNEESLAENFIRDQFANYFMSPEGALPWQLKKI
ncbi:uncharacterized protein LOC128199405 [Bicyclus anynana]|nr:uncharacterized protein LOC128199405 [Bicyclus anynana]